MNKIIFVRHGESVSNKHLHQGQMHKINNYADPELTSIGQQQAEQTAEHLKNVLQKEEKVAVFTSQYTRTQQTAKPYISSNTNVHHLHHMGLFNEYAPSYQKLPANIQHDNSWDDFTLRVKNFADNLLEISSNAVVFGHSLFISVLASYLILGTLPDKPLFTIPNASITTFVFENNMWHCDNVGSVNHLRKEVITGKITSI